MSTAAGELQDQVRSAINSGATHWRDYCNDAVLKVVEPDPGSSICCVSATCEDFAEHHDWHYHHEYELTYVKRSHGVRYIGDSIQYYEPGDLVLIGPELPHCWRNQGSRSGVGRVELVSIQFARDCFGPQFLEIPEAQSLNRLLTAAGCGLVFDRDVSEEAARRIEDLTKRRPMQRAVKLLEILDQLGTAPGNSRQTLTRTELVNGANQMQRQRLRLIRDYVRANLGGEITQAEMAQRLGLTASSFSRFFRAATGGTFVAFLNMMRVTEACRMLATTEQSITDIAMQCGYHNISHFNRQFLSIKNTSPSAYRFRVRDRVLHSGARGKVRLVRIQR